MYNETVHLELIVATSEVAHFTAVAVWEVINIHTWSFTSEMKANVLIVVQIHILFA